MAVERPKKVPKKRGRKRLVDGQQSEFIGFYIPQSMRELLDLEAAYNDVSLSKQLRMMIANYFEADNDQKNAG